jgi:hypothetical protein
MRGWKRERIVALLDALLSACVIGLVTSLPVPSWLALMAMSAVFMAYLLTAQIKKTAHY